MYRLSGLASRGFCVTSVQRPSKYSDSYDMSKDEVNEVLKKRVKKVKPLVMVASELSEEDPAYEKDISQTLSEI